MTTSPCLWILIFQLIADWIIGHGNFYIKLCVRKSIYFECLQELEITSMNNLDMW